MTDQKIPQALLVALLLLGFAMGSMFGGFFIIIGVIFDDIIGSLVIWAVITFASFVVFELLAWKYRGLFREWGLAEPKKKKEENKQ